MKTKLCTIGTALLCLLSVSCASEQKKARGDTAHYPTMTVTTQDVTLSQQYSARLTGRQIVEVRPQVTGNITRICIREGDDVKRGQTLFIIDQVPYRAALEVAVAARRSAEAKLATARMNYENEQRLQEGLVVGDVSVQTMRNALLEAEAALAQAKAQERNARNSLSYTEVKSPVSGVASMIPWHVGSLVSSSISEPLVTVADDHEMYAYFSISENQAIDLIGQYGSMEEFIRQAPGVGISAQGAYRCRQRNRRCLDRGRRDTRHFPQRRPPAPPRRQRQGHRLHPPQGLYRRASGGYLRTAEPNFCLQGRRRQDKGHAG